MKVWKFALDGFLLSKAYKVLDKKSTKELSLMTMKSDSNFEEKLTCLKNNMRNLMNFNLSSEKSENLHFDGIFLSKECNVWAKIIHTSCAVKTTYDFENDIGNFASSHTSSWK